MAFATITTHPVQTEYICERNYMKADRLAALGVKPAAPVLKRERACAGRDGKVQVENNLPEVQVETWVNESWPDSRTGRMSQIEGVITNNTGGQLQRLRLEFEPKDCVVDLWNLQQVEEGVYELAHYWLDDDWMGGMAPGVTLFWGGIFRGDKAIKLTFTDQTCS